MTERRRRKPDPRSSSDEQSIQVAAALEQIKMLATEGPLQRCERGPEALFWLFQIFPPPVFAYPHLRQSWLATVDWLAQSQSLPAIDSLRAALTELERGFIHPGLEQPPRGPQGGAAPTELLHWYQMAVEAAAEIAHRTRAAFAERSGSQAWGKERDYLIKSRTGVVASNLADWRRTLARGPLEYRPRVGWTLIYEHRNPLAVLRFAANKIRAANPKRGKKRYNSI